MKSIIKLLTILAVTAILSAAFCVFAESIETSVEIPREWLDQYAEKLPNSEIGIKHRFPDIPNDWSTDALVKAVQNGLLNGSDGKILPYDNLTRAQLATIMARAFGATETADVSSFTDLSSDAWYYNDMAKAVKMGIFRGDGSGIIRPNDSITRQEVFTVISRAFAINGSEASVLADFPDGDMVADWAKEATASLISQGYISGSGGYINPQNPITRAEFAQIMKNIVKAYITEEGVCEEVPEGNIIVRSSGVVFKGVTFKGDVFVGEGVGKSITFSECTSDNRIVIRGGRSTVLTGVYANITVVGSGLNINASAATVNECINNTDSIVTLAETADTDTDANTDADVNTDTDAEADVNADTDAETDADTDKETDADNTDDADENAGADIGADTAADEDTSSNTDITTDENADTDTVTDENADADTVTDENTDADADTDVTTDSNENADTEAATDTDTDTTVDNTSDTTSASDEDDSLPFEG